MPGPTKWTAPEPIDQCSAKSKQSGQQCSRYKTPGHKVCYYHGSDSPQAKSKVDRLFALAADIALETLVNEVQQAESSADRIRAARSILDRAGYGPLRRLEITTDALEKELEKVNREIAEMEKDL